jgi:integrase
MGSVAKETKPDGTRRWVARWRTPEGASRKKRFPTKVLADQHLVKVEGAKLTGAYVDPAAGRVTFRSYAEQWRTDQVQHRPTTVAQVETNMRRHVYPVLGDRPIGAIRRGEIQAMIHALTTKELAPGTVELVYRYVVAIYRSAITDRVVATSPCVDVKLPERVKAEIVPLSTSVVTALADAIDHRYRALVVVGAGTGLRQGEALGLTVDRVDFLRRTLKVDRQLILLPGAGPQLAPPKTPRSNRTIPASQVVIEALSAHVAQYGVGEDGLIFTAPNGAPIRRTRFSDVWRPAAKAAGIEAGIGYHALRHYYASLLIRAGCSVKVVQARLGHASASETLDTYSHLWPDDEDRARDAVDAVLGVTTLCPGGAVGA